MTDDTFDDNILPFRPPLRSTGSRSFPARSKASIRGFLIAKPPAETHWRQIIYESHLERKTALILLARPDLANFHDQPPAISYVNGRKARHVFDYPAEFTCGTRLAVAVKPHRRAEQTGFRHTLSRIRAELPHEFADEVILVTEKDLHRHAVRNAELLHLFRMEPDPEADQIIAGILATGPRKRIFSDVVNESALKGRGFRALFRAIHDGLADADRHKPIGNKTILYCKEAPDREVPQ